MPGLLLTGCIAFKNKSPENVIPMNSLLSSYAEAQVTEGSVKQ